MDPREHYALEQDYPATDACGYMAWIPPLPHVENFTRRLLGQLPHLDHLEQPCRTRYNNRDFYTHLLTRSPTPSTALMLHGDRLLPAPSHSMKISSR